MPARYGGRQAPFPAILGPVRRMAHGCASSAWTLGFYALHNWMLALFSEQAQSEAFATRPFLAPAPLAPTGRGVGCDGGIRLSGRWSWATGVMDGNWIIVAALCEREPGDPSTIYPVLALLPMDSARIDDEFVPAHRLVAVAGDPVARPVRGQARLAAAHIVHESRAVIGDLLGASGASAHFLDNPLQRIKRDVDVTAGQVVFDNDTTRELAGALTMGMPIPRTAMV